MISPRWSRPLAVGVTTLGTIVFAWLMVVGLSDPTHAHVIGRDHTLYRDAVLRLQAGGEWFFPEQIAGVPYVVIEGHVMYPPVAIAWLALSTWLPGILWYAIPLVVIAAVLIHHRPSAWGWAGIALCLAYPWSSALLLAGNPGLWVAAAGAVGTLWRPAFALVLLKPSLFPFALLGVRSKGWWLLVAIGAGTSVVLWPLTEQWLSVILNARGRFSGPLYALRDLGWMIAPLVAWCTGRFAPREQGELFERIQDRLNLPTNATRYQ